MVTENQTPSVDSDPGPRLGAALWRQRQTGVVILLAALGVTVLFGLIDFLYYAVTAALRFGAASGASDLGNPILTPALAGLVLACAVREATPKLRALAQAGLLVSGVGLGLGVLLALVGELGQGRVSSFLTYLAVRVPAALGVYVLFKVMQALPAPRPVQQQQGWGQPNQNWGAYPPGQQFPGQQYGAPPPAGHQTQYSGPAFPAPGYGPQHPAPGYPDPGQPGAGYSDQPHSGQTQSTDYPSADHRSDFPNSAGSYANQGYSPQPENYSPSYAASAGSAAPASSADPASSPASSPASAAPGGGSDEQTGQFTWAWPQQGGQGDHQPAPEQMGEQTGEQMGDDLTRQLPAVDDHGTGADHDRGADVGPGQDSQSSGQSSSQGSDAAGPASAEQPGSEDPGAGWWHQPPR